MAREKIDNILNSSLQLGIGGVKIVDQAGVLEVQDSFGVLARLRAAEPQNSGDVIVTPSNPSIGYARIETSASAPSDISGNTIWNKTDINTEGHYRYSTARSKWLSEERIQLYYGEDNATNGFAAPAGIVTSGNYTAYYLEGEYVLTEIHARSRVIQGANTTKDFNVVEVDSLVTVSGPHTMVAAASGQPSFFSKRDLNVDLTDPAINIQMVGGVAIRDFAFVIVLHRRG